MSKKQYELHDVVGYIPDPNAGIVYSIISRPLKPFLFGHLLPEIHDELNGKSLGCKKDTSLDVESVG